MSQELALEAIRNGENVAVLGAGGVGKTYTMKQVITRNTLVCAPSGIAALNIGGVTCHRAFGLPLGFATDADYMLTKRVREVLECVDRVVLDEAGMLRADQLDLINYKLQRAKRNNEPFGGVQMILVGDFLQLEPIVPYNEAQIFREHYSTPFCFGANAFKDFKVIELTKVYRQGDKRQVLMLNSIRKRDKWYGKAIQNILNECREYDPDEDQLHLCSRKDDAARINHKWYSKIDSKERVFYAYAIGNWKENEKPVPEQLQLKIGAKVIISANDMEGQYVNGERGEVVGMDLDRVMVRKENGHTVTVCEHVWEKYRYTTMNGELSKEVEAEFKQVPIKLGWAVTIHASQGLTLDKIAIDVGDGCFAHGQLYVALSRITDLRNLAIATPIRPQDVIVKKDAINFYRRISEN